MGEGGGGCFLLTSRNEDIVSISRHCVDDGVMTSQVLKKLTFWKLPLLQVVGRARRKSVPEEN